MKSTHLPPSARSLLSVGALLAFTFISIHVSFGLDLTLPLPSRPQGSNPAAFPTPKVDWLVRFQSNLNRTQGKNYDLIFDGDSITDFWQGTGKDIWAQHYESLNAVDFGISGDRTEHLLWRLDQGQVKGISPKLIVLMIGTNNTGDNTSREIAGGIKAIVADYRKLCPDAHLLLLGIFPRAASASDPIRGKITDINNQIATLDDGDKVTYLDIGPKFLDANGDLPRDIMPDGLHPSAKGYQIWADAIQPVVDKYCR